MIVYHGSFLEIPNPDVCHSRQRVDFGPGFYVTTLVDQAAKWCQRYKSAGQSAVVNRYVCDDDAYAVRRVLTFDSYSDEWLDFVLRCRSGNSDTPYEIVAGGMADDRVFNTVELFSEGLITREEALGRLRFERPNWQICFRTQGSLDACLSFEGSKEL